MDVAERYGGGGGGGGHALCTCARAPLRGFVPFGRSGDARLALEAVDGRTDGGGGTPDLARRAERGGGNREKAEPAVPMLVICGERSRGVKSDIVAVSAKEPVLCTTLHYYYNIDMADMSKTHSLSPVSQSRVFLPYLLVLYPSDRTLILFSS